jgi:hypothetical protein
VSCFAGTISNILIPKVKFQNQNSKFYNSNIKIPSFAIPKSKNGKSLFLAIGSKCVSIDK